MIRKEQQRFSLRKYKVGVASVFLGTTLSFLMANGGAVQASELPTQPASEEKTELVKKDVRSEDSSKKEQDVVANVATAEIAEGNKAEEAKPTLLPCKRAAFATSNRNYHFPNGLSLQIRDAIKKNKADNNAAASSRMARRTLT